MIIKSTSGIKISIVKSDGRSLFDSSGVEWARHPQVDDLDKGLAGYINTGNYDVMILTREELRRVIAGPKAVLTPTNMDEMRDMVSRSPKYIREVVSSWPDQRLREILIRAEENGGNPETLLYREVDKEIEAKRPKEEPRERPPEAKEEPRKRTPPRSTPRPRKQEGSTTVDLGEVSVLLTPKQLEFMERLSECPEWNGTPNGCYNAQEYVQELSDTMNPMSVGAVLTTLREKHLLATEKKRVGAIRCCIFRLTDLGVQVYNKLAGKEK